MTTHLAPPPATSASPNASARAACGGWLLAMALFTAAWVVLGFLNDGYVLFDRVIEDYSAIHQPISGLGLGSTATEMNAAFIVYGACAVIGAVGTSRLLGRIEPATQRPAMVSLGLHGVGSVLVGVFTLESMALHSLGFLFVLTPISGFWIIGRRLSRHPELRTVSRAMSWVAAPMSIALVAVFFVSFDPGVAGEGGGIGGLTQRALILHLEGWLAALIMLASRARRWPSGRGVCSRTR